MMPSLAVRTRALVGVAVASLIVLAADGRCEEAPAGKRPNIILFTVESLRTDHVGAYRGASRSRPDVPITPVIDALAAESVVYDNAYSVTSWTLPSHASLFTGLYPRAHQTRHSSDRLGDAYDTLAERLARGGYDTGGVVSGPYLRRIHNLSQGFAHYHDDLSTDLAGENHDTQTNTRMLEELRHCVDKELTPGKPFFLFGYFWDPHYDYLPPAPYDSMFVAPGSEKIDVRDYETTDTVNPGIRPAQLSWVLSQYAGEIRWTDAHLGEFFQFLKARGLWDDTVIIVTADHGEEFFDHGQKGHFHNLYSETTHVPLIVKYAKGGPKGRDPRLVSLVDVVPTAMEMAGLPVTGPVQGVSMLRKDPAPDRAIFFGLVSVWKTDSNLGVPDTDTSWWADVERGWHYLTNPGAKPIVTWKTWMGVRQGDRRLLVSPELARRELYDETSDPGETSDIFLKEKGTAAQLAEVLANQQKTAAGIARDYTAGGTADLSPEESERLRSLGYIQ